MSDELISALATAFLGAVLGSMLKGKWDRRVARRQPKTMGRAQAYEAFLAHMLAHAQPPNATKADQGLTHAVSRLILYGESEPLCAATDFMLKHRALDSDAARAALKEVAGAMRRSLKASSHDEVMGHISRLIRATADAGDGRAAAAAD
ncbi:MAG TPA: hypothetical protein VF142_20190 [Longimicrobium sp.]